MDKKEKKKLLHDLHKVEEWLRDTYGLVDNCCHTTEDLVECLEEAVIYFEKEAKKEIIKEFIQGRRCFSCGELHDEFTDMMSNTCIKCLNEE